MTENGWKGELCPKCLSTKDRATGSVPDGIDMNMAFRCEDCDPSWEGY